MPTTRPDAAPRRDAVPVLAVGVVLVATLLGACSTDRDRSAEPSTTATPVPTASPSPTPVPTPYFTNLPDAELAALIPTEVAGQAVVIPPVTDFSITPGDIGQVYGEIGLRFRSLQLAFVPRPPRLSLFAVRMQRPFATTAELEPYLAEAARYVGIAGLHREPWSLEAVGDHLVWVRPEDNATLPGTRVYTWAIDGFLFLMIGVDEAQNLAMLAALPAEPAPTPTPDASVSASPSLEPSTAP
jgi:hypothetical protein